MRIFVLLGSFALLLIFGCNVQVNPFKEYYHKQANFVKAADIKAGEKLRKAHPDESFVINNYSLEISFTKNKEFEEWQKKKTEKKKKFKTLKWTKNRVSYSVDLNDEFSDSEVKKIKEEYESRQRSEGSVDEDEFQEYIEQLKRDRNTTPPGRYMSAEKHLYEVTSLEDDNRLPVFLFFNNGEAVKNFKFDYGRGAFEPDYLVRSHESEGIFHNDVKTFLTTTYMPTLGSRVYVQYDHEYPDLTYNTVVYIPEEHYTENKTVSFAIPAWLDVTIVEKNFEGLKYTKTTAAPKKFKKKMLPNVVKDADFETDPDAAGKKPKKGKGSTKKEPTAGLKYITYTFQGVKPFSSEKGSRGASYNYPHLLIQYNSATEGTKKEQLTGTLPGLYHWYHSLVKQLENDTVELKKFTKKLLEGKTTDEEKVKAIYYWVQDNIRYIAFEDGIAGFKPEECADVYNNRYGDCKGMANLLVNMLKINGYDARRVWIGTRHLNYDYSTPSLAVDNHMICALKLDTGFVYLDGTESFCPLNQYAHRIQGRQVLIENGDTFVVSRVPEFGPEYNLEQTKVSAWFDGKELMAHVDQTMHGESRLDFIRSLNLLRSQNRENALYRYVSNNNISIEPSNIKTSELDDRESASSLSYDAKVYDHIIRTGDKIYINLDWNKELDDFSFDTTRRTDFDFGGKLCQKSETTMDLGSFTVVHLPAEVVEDNKYYKIVLRMAQTGKTLYYRKEIIIKEGYLPVSEMKRWNAVNEKMTSFYNDYIILK